MVEISPELEDDKGSHTCARMLVRTGTAKVFVQTPSRSCIIGGISRSGIIEVSHIVEWYSVLVFLPSFQIWKQTFALVRT